MKIFHTQQNWTFGWHLHAIVDGEISVRLGHELAHQLKDTLQEEIPNLGHVLIHIEPSN